MDMDEFPRKESASALALYGTGCAHREWIAPLSVLEHLASALRTLRYARPVLPVADFVNYKVDEDVACFLSSGVICTDWEESRWEYHFSDGILWDTPPNYRGPTCGLHLLRFFGLLHEAARGICCGLTRVRPDLALKLAMDVMPDDCKFNLKRKYNKKGELLYLTSVNDKSIKIKIPDYRSQDTDLFITDFVQALQWSDDNPYEWSKKKPKKNESRSKRKHQSARHNARQKEARS